MAASGSHATTRTRQLRLGNARVKVWGSLFGLPGPLATDKWNVVCGELSKLRPGVMGAPTVDTGLHWRGERSPLKDLTTPNFANSGCFCKFFSFGFRWKQIVRHFRARFKVYVFPRSAFFMYSLTFAP